jgi:hypothetical protein
MTIFCNFGVLAKRSRFLFFICFVLIASGSTQADLIDKSNQAIPDLVVTIVKNLTFNRRQMPSAFEVESITNIKLNPPVTSPEVLEQLKSMGIAPPEYAADRLGGSKLLTGDLWIEVIKTENFLAIELIPHIPMSSNMTQQQINDHMAKLGNLQQKIHQKYCISKRVAFGVIERNGWHFRKFELSADRDSIDGNFDFERMGLFTQLTLENGCLVSIRFSNKRIY